MRCRRRRSTRRGPTTPTSRVGRPQVRRGMCPAPDRGRGRDLVRVRPSVPRPATGSASHPPGTSSLAAMDLTLTPAQLELQARARTFVRDVLQPREVEFERANGRVPRDWGAPIRRAAIEARLHGGSLPMAVGGQGWSVLEQVLVHEQLGQATGGLWSYIPGAYNVLIHADAEQRATVPRPEPARRALGQLRDHRGRGRLRRADAAGDRRPRRRHRRVRPQRREVVRHRAGRHGLHDLPLPASSTARSGCRRSSSSTTTRPASSCATTPTTPTRSPTATPSSC